VVCYYNGVLKSGDGTTIVEKKQKVWTGHFIGADGIIASLLRCFAAMSDEST